MRVARIVTTIFPEPDDETEASPETAYTGANWQWDNREVGQQGNGRQRSNGTAEWTIINY